MKAIKRRNPSYNQTVEDIIQLEKEGKIFVIRPTKKIPIKIVEHNPKMVQDQYDLGVEDFSQKKDELYSYLK